MFIYSRPRGLPSSQLQKSKRLLSSLIGLRTLSSMSNPQTVLITGAAVRVGKAIAEYLASAGWQVAIHYNTSDKEAKALEASLKAQGAKVALIQADLKSDFDAEAILSEVETAIGPVHCLINNAATFHKDTLEIPITQSQFDDHMHVNLLAPLKLVQAFTKQARHHELKNASIINIGDGMHGWSYSSKHLTYALSKQGLMSLSHFLALDLAPDIRINSIGLGPTLPGPSDKPDTFDRLQQRIPLHTLSSLEDICRTVDFLLQSPTITGQNILLTGGLHCTQAIDI